MNWRGYLVGGSIIASLALLVGGIGVIAVYRTFWVYDIPWERHPLPIPPKGTTLMLYVDTQSQGNDPTGDKIYVTTRDGTVYSNTLFEDKWVPSQPVDGWDGSRWCVAPGPPSHADLWEPDPPPAEKSALDTAGWRWGDQWCSILISGAMYSTVTVVLKSGRVDRIKATPPDLLQMHCSAEGAEHWSVR